MARPLGFALGVWFRESEEKDTFEVRWGLRAGAMTPKGKGNTDWPFLEYFLSLRVVI